MSSQKRKRSASVFSSTSRASSPASSSRHHHLPRDAINPLSHSESTIKQLRVAGLTENDLLPSARVPDFPHRPLPLARSQQQQRSDDDDDDDDHQDRARDDRRAQHMRDALDAHIGVLRGLLVRALQEDDLPRAKRAFGLLRRSEVRGREADLRRGGLWALGAEVLMREGEEPRGVGDGGGGAGAGAAGREQDQGSRDADGTQQESERERMATATRGALVRRWGTTANMPRVRAYLEGLIRTYPYNRLHPNSTSDLDFYPVLFGYDLYDAWVEHRLALERLERDAEAWSDEDVDVDMDMSPAGYDYDNYDDHHHHHHSEGMRLTARERRLREAKAGLALPAMAAVRGIAARMDTLLENAPYNRSAEMLRLRGMVALYVGDLSVPPPPRTADEEEEGKRVRRLERDRARTFFAKMRESGGRVDALVEKWLEGVGDDDDDYGADEDEDMEPAWSGLPVFSSLPRR